MDKTMPAKLANIDKLELCQMFPLIVNRAGALGLFKTMHALNDAQNVLGFEVAEHIALLDASHG